MYEYDDLGDQGDSNLWRNLAIVAAAGLGAYLAYQLVSNPERAKELGRKAREKVGEISEKASDMAGKAKEKVQNWRNRTPSVPEQVDTSAPSGQFA